MLKSQRNKNEVVKDVKEKEETTVKSHMEILAKDETEEVVILNRVQSIQDQEETAVGSHYLNIQIKFNCTLGI